MRRTTADPLLQMRDVRTHFFRPQTLADRLQLRSSQAVRAVDGISLDILRGEVVGLVGESGSGKTTLGKTILGLTRPTSGSILYNGEDISRIPGRRVRRLRREMQMIFQDPYSSLSPRLRVSYLLTEPYVINRVPAKSRLSVEELLGLVGLPSEIARKYPHQLSAGQARRVGIARALALRPQLLIADEPTAGLDVSAASSILNLMKELGHQLGLTYLIITHNLNIVGYIADRIAVMYLGEIVEVGPTGDVFDSPAHPYTQALLSAIADIGPRRQSERRLIARGEIPSPQNPPPGCRFHTRCPFAQPQCRAEHPDLERVAFQHFVACPLWQEIRQLSASPVVSSRQ